MDNMITTHKKLKEDPSALQSKFEDVLAKYEAAQNEVNKLKENLLSVEENYKNEVKEKKVLKKLRQKARLNAEKVKGITEFGFESPRIDPVRCAQLVKHPSTPLSPHTHPGTSIRSLSSITSFTLTCQTNFSSTRPACLLFTM